MSSRLRTFGTVTTWSSSYAPYWRPEDTPGTQTPTGHLVETSWSTSCIWRKISFRSPMN